MHAVQEKQPLGRFIFLCLQFCFVRGVSKIEKIAAPLKLALHDNAQDSN